IRVFQTEQPENTEEEEDGGDMLPSIAAFQTLRREGQTLVVLEEWVSAAEKVRRRETEEARVRHDRELSEFKASDPLYLAYLQHLMDPAFTPENYESYGITYDGWCPDF